MTSVCLQQVDDLIQGPKSEMMRGILGYLLAISGGYDGTLQNFLLLKIRSFFFPGFQKLQHFPRDYERVQTMLFPVPLVCQGLSEPKLLETKAVSLLDSSLLFFFLNSFIYFILFLLPPPNDRACLASWMMRGHPTSRRMRKAS